MRIVLKVLYGLGLGVICTVICLSLGLVPFHRSWAAILVLGVMLVTTQVVAFLAFRYRVAWKVLLGVLLAMAVGYSILFSSFPLFWESQYVDGSYPITWRSDLVFLLVLAASEGVVFSAYRIVRAVRRG